MEKLEIISLLQNYKPDHEIEVFHKEQIFAFVNSNDVLGRNNPDGHITGSAWIVNISRDKVLLTHHRKLDKWIQLGGHCEENESVFFTAFREAKEESGLSSIKEVSPMVFDVAVHHVPSHKGEREHFHYDLRFLFEGDETEAVKVTKESKDVKWISLSEIHLYTQEESTLRMAHKISQP